MGEKALDLSSSRLCQLCVKVSWRHLSVINRAVLCSERVSPSSNPYTPSCDSLKRSGSRRHANQGADQDIGQKERGSRVTSRQRGFIYTRTSSLQKQEDDDFRGSALLASLRTGFRAAKLAPQTPPPHTPTLHPSTHVQVSCPKHASACFMGDQCDAVQWNPTDPPPNRPLRAGRRFLATFAELGQHHAGLVEVARSVSSIQFNFY